MNISSMKFDNKTYVNPNLESKFRELPIVQAVFALDDSLLEYKQGTYYYSKDNNIIFYDNYASQALPKGKTKKYDTLEFVKHFIVGKKNPDYFRLSTLMLNYYYLNYENKKILWQDSFKTKYGVMPPDYRLPSVTSKLNFIVQNHNDSNNKYLIAHFSKMHNINEYIIRDMIFRKFLVSDSLRIACFPIYSDFRDRKEVVGMHFKSTKYNNSFTDYQAPPNNEVYCYTTPKYENNTAFTYLHIFETPLELMKYVSLIKNKIVKFPRGSSHLFAVFNTANDSALDNLCKKYHFDSIKYTGKNRLYIEMVSSISIKTSTIEQTSSNVSVEAPITAKKAVTVTCNCDDDEDEEMPF